MIVDWKAPSESLADTEKGQAANEGRYFLKRTGRPFVYVMLSNFSQFIFYKVGNSSDGVKYYQSDRFDANKGFAHHHHLLSKGSAFLGSDQVPAIDGIKVGVRLGEGATSVVYEGAMETNDFRVAVKVVSERFEQQAAYEVVILRALSQKQIGIPFIPFTVDLPERVVVISPVLNKVTCLTWRQVQGLKAAIEHVHHRGYFHRDIRPGNIMVSNTQEIYLVDFGYAISKNNPPDFYAGTRTTASNRILTILAGDKYAEFQFLEKDDVQSFVKTVYFFVDPNAYEDLPANDSPTIYKDLVSFWEKSPKAWAKDLEVTTLRKAEIALAKHFRKEDSDDE